MRDAIQNHIDDVIQNNNHEILAIALAVFRHPVQNSGGILDAIRANANSALINVTIGAGEAMAHVDGFRDCLSSLTQPHVKDIVMRTCADIILSVGEDLNGNSTDQQINAKLDIAVEKLDAVISILRSLLPKDKALADRLIAEINFAKAVLSNADKVKKFFKPNGFHVNGILDGLQQFAGHAVPPGEPPLEVLRRRAICERLHDIREDNYHFSEDGHHSRLLERAKKHIKKTVEKERKFHRASFEAHRKHIIGKYGKENCKVNDAGDLFYVDKKGHKKALVKSA